MSSTECIACKNDAKQRTEDRLVIAATFLAVLAVVVFLVRKQMQAMERIVQERQLGGDSQKSNANKTTVQLMKSMLAYVQLVAIAKEVQVKWNPLVKQYLQVMETAAAEVIWETQAFACNLNTTYFTKWRVFMLVPLLAFLLPGAAFAVYGASQAVRVITQNPPRPSGSLLKNPPRPSGS